MARTPRAQTQEPAIDAANGNLFERVTRAAQVAYYEWQVGTDTVFASPALMDMFGHDPRSWNAQRHLEIMHPDDQPGFLAATRAALKGDAGRYDATYRVKHADDAWRWVHNQAVIERDSAGRVTRMTGVVTDITEARQREADLREALDQQTATAEVLRVINTSPGDLRPVFTAMLEKAAHLCVADFGELHTFDGEKFHAGALLGVPAALSEFRMRTTPATPPGSVLGEILGGARVLHILDAKDHDLYRTGEPSRVALVDLGGARTVLAVALRKDDALLGLILIYRQEVRPFGDRQVALLENFAAQAVIAMENARLLGELRERTAALAQRNSEFGERIEQQSATIDVLKVMSSSPGDPQPVFDLIAERARAFAEADASAVTTVRDGMLHLRAHTGTVRAQTEAFRSFFPRPLDNTTVQGRAIIARDAVLVPDVTVDPQFVLKSVAAAVSLRSMAAVPMLRGGEAMGAIILSRSEPSLFADTQIELLRTFAEQAVIAISSAETYRELQERTAALAQRNSEFGERIEQQSATIDVLKVMSASPGDPQPVFDVITQRAAQLCAAPVALLFRFDGKMVHFQSVGGTGDTKAETLFETYRQQFPMPPTRQSIACRSILESRIVHVRDVDADPEIFQAARNTGTKSVLSVPLLRDGIAIGAIGINAAFKGGFSDSQVALLQTFAEQAVIAISSAETYRELQERTAALAQRNSEFGERIEQQSATIDVLKVMSSSPGDPQPVFHLVAQRANAFCNTEFSAVGLVDDGKIHLSAVSGTDAEWARELQAAFPVPVNGRLTAGKAILTRAVAQNPDTLKDTTYSLQGVAARMRSNAAVPILRDDVAIGVIAIGRSTPGAFTDSQIELLQTFAEQAVIAITSAETYRELQARTAALALRNSEFGERIEQQAATIDVLKVMSSSPGDPQPVFELIAERAGVFCGAEVTGVALTDGKRLFLKAYHGITGQAARDYEARVSGPVDRGTLLGRAIVDRDIVQIPDFAQDPEYAMRHVSSAAGGQSGVGVPMLRGGTAIGSIVLARRRAGEFSPIQVELLQTFAEQAVIAISSAETYRELQERTAALAQRNSEYGERIEQQSATIDVLKVMSASPGDPQPVFDLIAERARLFSQSDAVVVIQALDGTQHLRAHSGSIQRAEAAYAANFPRPIDESNPIGQAILARRTIEIENLQTESQSRMSGVATVMDLRAVIAIPMLRGTEAIGGIGIGRVAAGTFSPTQIELLQTFAEQAVIAITSAENYRALQDRTDELSRSVAELQALEETIRSVNSSLDLDTVLATIISRAVRLSQADEGTIYEYDEHKEIFVPKAAHGMSEARVEGLRERRIRMGETHLGRAAVARAPVHVEDVQLDASIPGVAELLAGIHAVLAVPLLRDDKVVGGMVIRRRSEGAFAPTTVTLLQTFAGQSVLAIENARLFQEAGRARAAAESTLTDLRRTQDRLVQTEKMASLGQLTAGIAHEIKNPLNFVNNFSDLSVDLLSELNEAIAPEKLTLAADLRAEIDDLTATLTSNLQKITEHGKRADSIVKNMLLHSRTGTSERRAVDLNAAAEEALNLAYHGARAERQGFNITMQKDLDPSIGTVEIYPQEIARVLVNLINNGFYAAHKRAEKTPNFEPILRLATKNLGDRVEIRVRDNGIGIPVEMRNRIFEPFFTTKPAGEGTGLGLSLSFDIVVKQHGGQLTVASEPDSFTEFTITLPRATTRGRTDA